MKHLVTSLLTLVYLVATPNVQAQTTACTTEAIALSSEAAASAYLWQIQEASAWNDLTDGGSYSGAATSLLTIEPVTETMDGNAYRCLVPSVQSPTPDSVVFQTALSVINILSPSAIAWEDGSDALNLCHGANTTSMVQETAPGGSDGMPLTSWQVLMDGAWTSLEEETEANLILQNLTESTSVRQVTSSEGTCGGTVYSNVLNIGVLQPLVSPLLSSSADTVCFGSPLTVTASVPSLLVDEVSFGWFISPNGEDFQVSASSDGPNWGLASSENDQQVYLQLSSLFGCGSLNSDTVVIETLAPLLEASLAFDNDDGIPLCNGNESPNAIVIEPAEGADGDWTNTWQAAIDGAGWNNAQIGGSTFAPGAVTESFSVRLESTSEFGCGQLYSNVISMSVWEDLTAPIIDIEEQDDAICFETSPGPLNMTLSSDGGSNAWSYQWQVDVDGEWTNVPGAAGPTYTPGALTNDGSFRILAQEAQCGDIPSDPLDIQVFAPLSTQMTITSNVEAPLCNANEGANFVLNSVPTGGGEAFTYQWFIGDEALTGATDLAWEVSFLDSTSVFHLLATSVEGCGDVVSNEIQIEVFQPLGMGATSEDQTICYDTAPTPLSCEGANGGSGNYDYQWEVDLLGSWFPVAGENITTVSPNNQIVSLAYRLRATDSNGCGAIVSESIVIDVLDSWVPGEVVASTYELCYQDGFTVETEGPMGADGDFASTWFLAINGGGFLPSDSIETLAWGVPSAEDDYDVFLQSSSNFGCGTLASDTIHVEVLDPAVAPEIVFPNFDGVDLCFGDLAPSVAAQELASGADGNWVYSWEESGTNEIWNNAQNNPDPYSAGELTDSTLIRLVGTSVFGCGDMPSNPVLIPVWDDVVPGQINYASEETICFGAEAATLLASEATGGGNVFDVQWYTESGTSPIPFAQTLSVAPGNLTDTTTFVLEYTNLNGCGTVSSNPIQFSVLPDLQTGTVEGWNGVTLCYNDPLTMTLEGVQDYPWLSHQWFQTNAMGESTALPGFESLTAPNHPVLEPSSFYVETTSNFGCGAIESTSLFVSVWANLEPATIAVTEEFDGATLCHLDSSPDFTTLLQSIGGGGPLVYEWETQTGLGSPFVPTGLDSLEHFNPGALEDTLRVRLRVTDLYGCGTRVSNAEQVNVFAPLQLAVQPSNTPTCFGATPLNFSGVPSGGGDLYSLQWYSSETDSDFVAVEGQEAMELAGLSLVNDTWFYLNVISDLGCGFLQSDTALAFVLEPLVPGAIDFTFNPICAEDPASVESTLPAGGFENFVYSWFQSEGNEWLEFNEDDDTFVSALLYENTSFFSAYTDDCGTVFSDTLEVIVNPLPVIDPIVGQDSPCYGSVNQTYLIPNWNYTWTYAWNVDSELGEITSGESVDEILVNWFDLPAETSVGVQVTNPTTACSDGFTFPVTILDVMAPPPSLVVKKPGINILVSADSTACALHQWGAQNIETGQITYFPGLDEQYAYFENLDTLSFHYFVEVVYNCGDGASCPTTNFYNFTPFVGVDEAVAPAIELYPNPASNVVSLRADQGLRRIVLHNASGIAVSDLDAGGSPMVNINVEALPRGFYVATITSTSGLTTFTRFILR